MVGNHVADLVTRYGETSAAVPAELTGYIKGRAGYDYSHHGRAGNPSTDFVPDEVVERFCLLGPPGAQLDRLAELRELGVRPVRRSTPCTTPGRRRSTRTGRRSSPGCSRRLRSTRSTSG